jgi:PPOX class probable F420-dependent enzyme
VAVSLTEDQRLLLAEARTATLATMSPDARPRLVPVCFVLVQRLDSVGRPLVYTPLDDKPKRDEDRRKLARVRDLLILPEATLLVDRWDEDWSRLAWLRAYGAAELLEPQPRERDEHATAVALLREKYPQYRTHALAERPLIRVALERIVSWSAVASGPTASGPGPAEAAQP